MTRVSHALDRLGVSFDDSNLVANAGLLLTGTLSSQLDLRSLVATIQDTAKEVLHCGRAALYLWNARDSRLVNA